MTSLQTETLWNFSDVYSLLDTLSRSSRSPTPSGVDPPAQNGPRTQSTAAEELDAQAQSRSKQQSSKRPAGLGDFSQIWQYLGTRAESETVDLSTSPTLEKRLPSKIEYTSDGAVCTVPSSAKKLQWRDEVNDGTLTDVAPAHSDHAPVEKLSKKQKKTLAKRKGTAITAKTRVVSDQESEADVPSPSKNPAARASVHSMKASSTAKATPTSSERSKAGYGTDGSCEDPDEEYDPIAQQLADASRNVLARYNSEPPESKDSRKTPPATKKEWPVSNPTSAQALAFLPGSMRPRKSPQSETAVMADLTPTRGSGSRQAIAPKIIRSGTDRHWAFLLKLIANFYEDRASLIAPANLSNHSSDPSGIHVFVDASNIFIGFHDQLKRARGIPTTVRVPRVDMSFDALALLLERRRPVAKRVLAGSTPEVPAFDIARRIGYECSILDKVYKARELTSRQRYFIKRDKQAAKAEDGYSSGGGSAASLSGDANVMAPTHAPSKFVEQGVDEILHLKMLESVVDAADDEHSNPHPTMVLATGDAAQAEYSSGFMVMVERALKRGWNVELVSWSANISSAYRRDDFLRKWTGRFKIVELDDYAEELLDM